MVPVDGPQVPGAMMMANGQYAVPALDLQAYNQKSSGPAPVQEKKPDIPDDLLCSICSDLLADAVMIPCCGKSTVCLIKFDQIDCFHFQVTHFVTNVFELFSWTARTMNVLIATKKTFRQLL